jgi:hypothetical protein
MPCRGSFSASRQSLFCRDFRSGDSATKLNHQRGVASQRKSSTRNCIGAMSAGRGTEKADLLHLAIT